MKLPADFETLAKTHYENFPVGSWLLPKRLRQAVRLIYTFARIADDLADEGNADSAERLAGLAALRAALVSECTDQEPFWSQLKQVIQDYTLPSDAFLELLSAFEQDIHQTRYATLDELFDYAARSANPVGRLILALAQALSSENLVQSNAICTALQFINFAQDLAQDWQENQRLYIPLTLFEKYGLDPNSLDAASSNHTLWLLMREFLMVCHGLMENGYLLGSCIRGRIGWEIRAMTLAGIETLSLLAQCSPSTQLKRPRLTRVCKLKMVALSSNSLIFKKAAQNRLKTIAQILSHRSAA